MSSTPAMPSTRSGGKPLRSRATWVISSSGLLTTTRTAWGATAASFSATEPTISALTAVRSVRDIPGLRGLPAVMTT